MSALYRPVLIESAEQAEALPEGAIVPVEDKDGPWEKRSDGKFQGAGRIIVDAHRVLDRIALVPIEAEAEHEEARSVSVLHGSTWTWPGRTRLVTPWEEV